MKTEELLRCQINEWYPTFRRHTVRTLFHPLPASFVRYLLGLPLAADDAAAANSSPSRFRLAFSSDPIPPVTVSSILPDPDSSSFSDSDDSPSSLPPPSFPDLDAAVARSIETLGGAAFPKLNWSAPKDAAWISPTGSLQCASLADVALLLHSSDSAAHDLSEALPSCTDAESNANLIANFEFVLALREWCPGIQQQMEFRCFVHRRHLRGISQRLVTEFYPTLNDRRSELLAEIQSFFTSVVLPQFGLDDYTFDVYVRSDGKVKLVDFNPWGGFTLPLLFDWDELETESELEFRVVEDRCGVQPGLKTAVPHDYVDTEEGSALDVLLKKIQTEMCVQMKASDAEQQFSVV